MHIGRLPSDCEGIFIASVSCIQVDTEVALQMLKQVTAISGGLSSFLSPLNHLATPMSGILP